MTLSYFILFVYTILHVSCLTKCSLPWGVVEDAQFGSSEPRRLTATLHLSGERLRFELVGNCTRHRIPWISTDRMQTGVLSNSVATSLGTIPVPNRRIEEFQNVQGSSAACLKMEYSTGRLLLSSCISKISYQAHPGTKK